MEESFYDVVPGTNHIRTITFPIQFTKQALQITPTDLQDLASSRLISNQVIYSCIDKSKFKVYLRELDGEFQQHKLSFIAFGI